jgi:probable F420-dependent oxidoreductase
VEATTPARASGPVKVRIGVGTGVGANTSASTFAQLVDDLDELGFDSVWLPEVLTAPTLDPLVGLSFAAAHNPRLKLGTTMLLPGRNPVRLAKELATLDVLSGGRLLCTFVPGLARRPEIDAAGVAVPDKAGLMDEMLPLLRSLWAGETVTHHGMAAHIDQVALWPLPVQQPLEFWTGGMVPAALRRCGRFADGWLPSACTPAEVAAARVVIDESAAEAGRAISPEHFGVSVAYAPGPLTPQMARAIGASRRGVDPAEVVPVGIDGLRSMLEGFVAVGFSKFVVRPLAPPDSWRAELESLAKGVLDLQT